MVKREDYLELVTLDNKEFCYNLLKDSVRIQFWIYLDSRLDLRQSLTSGHNVDMLKK